jgi:type I restriction enzyme S subunit
MGDNRPTLRDILAHTRDGEWGSEAPGPGLVPMTVIRGTDFADVRLGLIDTAPVRYIPEHISERKKLEPWDILLETAGGSKGRPTGRSLLVSPRLLDSHPRLTTCASFARFLRVDPQKADPAYVYWYLQYLYATNQMEQHQVQHTGVARFQFTRFAETQVVELPSPSQQRAIAHILGTLDDKIELNRRMNETLEAMARALFKSWFVDFDPVRAKAEGHQPPGMDATTAALFPSKFHDSELGEIPMGWRVRAIGEAVTVVGGSTPRTAEPAFWDGGNHYWATPKDLSGKRAPVLLETERRITDAGVAQISSGLLPAGTLLLSSRAPIGYLAIAQIPVAVNQGFIAIPPGGMLSSAFLLFWIHFNMDQILSRAGGTTFQEISKRNFRPLPSIVPSPDILERFTLAAQPLIERITNNERESRNVERVRDALLPRLLSGELSVGKAMKAVEARA